MSELYTLAQLNQMILLAMQLGYKDDVAHWKAERERVLRTHPGSLERSTACEPYIDHGSGTKR